MLEIRDLHVAVGGKEILKGLSLSIPSGEVHAIMGPNGSGKSTLSYTIAGREGYEVVSGDILYRGESILGLAPEERAAKGIFLALQYPIEIPGVTTMTFLRTAVNAQRKARGQQPMDAAQFLRAVRAKGKTLNVGDEMLKRPLNAGFSGGEKKRAEMVQMGILDPKFAVLDETDSGLDIDALRIVGEGINAIMRQKAGGPEKAVLLITHYQRLLDYVKPDFVHVLAGGRIVKTGGPDLALELEERGYEAVAA